jgi:putative zinc finger protein
MVATCEVVRREISNYLDGEAGPELRAAMEAHLRGCQPCRTVLDGTRNVVGLFGEERMFEPPVGFSQRLQQKLEQNMPRKRGPAFGWMVAFAAAALVVLSFQVGNSSTFVRPRLRSEQAQLGNGVPADLMVVVSDNGKTFHVAGCTFIHDKAKLRTITASEAQKEGYAPCVRCMRKYLTNAAHTGPDTDVDEVADAPEFTAARPKE